MELIRETDETWSSYVRRMRTHKAWDTKNISAWDLSLEGAAELNSYLNTSPDTYLFFFCVFCNIQR